MSNHENTMRLVWVPVVDERGHTRMEMRWLDTQAAPATQMPHAA